MLAFARRDSEDPPHSLRVTEMLVYYGPNLHEYVFFLALFSRARKHASRPHRYYRYAVSGFLLILRLPSFLSFALFWTGLEVRLPEETVNQMYR